MDNTSSVFQKAYEAKPKLDRHFKKDNYRLMGETFVDANLRPEGDLPPLSVAVGTGPLYDQYAFVELNQPTPRIAKIHLSMVSEVMMLRVVIDRLDCNKAPIELLNQLRLLVAEVAKHSAKAERPPDPPKKDKPEEDTKEEA